MYSLLCCQQVSWIRRMDYTILTIGTRSYSSDKRFYVDHTRHLKVNHTHMVYIINYFSLATHALFLYNYIKYFYKYSRYWLDKIKRYNSFFK